jgi:UDP-glucose 4-epimerase
MYWQGNIMTYFITGGCGFIGSHFAEELVKDKQKVVIYDNLSSGYEKNISHIRDMVTFIKGDIRDRTALRQAMQGCQYVIHLAALVSVFDSVNRPDDNHSINITGTYEVLAATHAVQAKRLIIASSAAVYGNDPALPKTETMLPTPVSPYGMAKLTGEYYCRVFSEVFNLETVALRFFNVFGPRQDPGSMYSGVISKFTDMLKKNLAPTIYGDGLQTRDFVFVKDVVQAGLKALTSSRSGNGEVINVATENAVSLLELLNTMNELMGLSLQPLFKEVRVGDVRHSRASIDRARELLGYQPAYSLKQGLESLLKYYG